MGRKKTFAEQDALEAATRCFWSEGFAGTTFQQLEAHTGLSGRSLINCFGDKDTLFAAALGHYRQAVAEELASITESGAAAILRFFRKIADAPAHSLRHRGCLIINSLGEGRGEEAKAKVEIEAFRQLLRQFFREALRQEGIKGKKSKADFILTLLWGSSSEIRQQGSTQAIVPVIKTLEECLASWPRTAKA